VSVEGWQWRWLVDGADLAGDGPRQSWRTGRLGTHRVAVTATSTDGTSKTATLELEVVKTAFIDELRGRVAPPSQPVDPSIHDVPFGFADIVVEKSAVCVGEPTLIRTTATSKSGATGNLITAIAGIQGSAGSFFRFDGEPGMRRVTMTLRDPDLPGKFAEAEVFIELKDCYASASLFVEATADQVVPDRYALRAKLLKVAKGKAPTNLADAAAAYEWDFGDGQKVVTKEPETGHTFPPEKARPASEYYHSYLVTVAALDPGGRPLAKGYAPVFFYNLRRQSKNKHGLVELVARFRDLVETDDKGNKSLSVTLENIDDTETVRLTEVRLRNLSCDGTTQTESTVDVSSVFPEATIGPRGSVTGTLTVSEPGKRNLCRIFATVTGRSAPGSLDATGAFAMTVGDAFRQTITDQTQLDVIRQVTAILGQAAFTDEDVRRLEDEGKIPRGVLRNPRAAPPAPPPGNRR
jgi:hypothetical protein